MPVILTEPADALERPAIPMPTLYITRENGTLAQSGNALQWRAAGDKKKTTLPAAQISDVIVVGQGNITTQALHLLMDLQIPVHYLTSNGRYKGSLTSGRRHSFQTWNLHYHYASDPELSLKVAKNIITGKILNQRNTLLRYHYRRGMRDNILAETAAELKDLLTQLSWCKEIDQVRGVEGIAAKSYFRAFASIIQPPWQFKERNRRPPKDPVNAMLSFGYTLLLGSVVTAILIAGLDPCVGFVHPEYRGRPSLALDLMEEFRASVVDRMVLSVCGQMLLNPQDFEGRGGEGVIMTADARKRFLKFYSERIKTEVQNQGNNFRTSIENHIRLQSAFFLRSMRNETDYLPFVMGK